MFWVLVDQHGRDRPGALWEGRVSEPIVNYKLAILPNGEAIDPSLVKAVLIEPGLGLATDMNERFDVCILFYDKETRSVAKGIVREDAERISRLCARAVNEARAKA